MGASLVSLGVAMVVVGQHQPGLVHRLIARCYPPAGGRITPPGPGPGWGFVNGNPDGYGWVDYGTTLPMGGDRTPDYFFRRQFALPADQVFMPSYYNPYVTRGQRYISYAGCGGWHPAGGSPTGSALTPTNPYEDSLRESASNAIPITPPRFTGRTEAQPVPSGNSGLIP